MGPCVGWGACDLGVAAPTLLLPTAATRHFLRPPHPPITSPLLRLPLHASCFRWLVLCAGKAAVEAPPPVVARELTPEEAAVVEADVAATRKRLLASTTCTVRVEVVLVLEGPV